MPRRASFVAGKAVRGLGGSNIGMNLIEMCEHRVRSSYTRRRLLTRALGLAGLAVFGYGLGDADGTFRLIGPALAEDGGSGSGSSGSGSGGSGSGSGSSGSGSGEGGSS